jgi:hypothetical protein
MKNSLTFILTIFISLISFGQRDSSRLNWNNYIDYIGDDSTQAFFWNGDISRCPIPSPLFNTLDSLESEVIVVILYMPVRYEENGELNNKKVKETIQNIQGGEKKMYFLGFDLINETLNIYTCQDYWISTPIKSFRRRSNKLLFTTEDNFFKGNYKIKINRDKKVICNVYNKRDDKSEILYSTKPELIQIYK